VLHCFFGHITVNYKSWKKEKLLGPAGLPTSQGFHFCELKRLRYLCTGELLVLNWCKIHLAQLKVNASYSSLRRFTISSKLLYSATLWCLQWFGRWAQNVPSSGTQNTTVLDQWGCQQLLSLSRCGCVFVCVCVSVSVCVCLCVCVRVCVSSKNAAIHASIHPTPWGVFANYPPFLGTHEILQLCLVWWGQLFCCIRSVSLFL